MSPRTAGIILALTFPLAAHAAGAGVLVAFRTKATATGPLVTLADVADVRSTDLADGQRLSTVILGPAPAAGQNLPLSFETVRSRLAAAGANLADIEFSGPTTVAVYGPLPATTSLPQYPKSRPTSAETKRRAVQAVAEAVRRYLASKAGLPSAAVQPQIADGEFVPIASAESGGFDVSGGAAPWTGTQTFTLRFLDADEKVREVRVSCTVSPRPSVLAAKHAIPKGQVVRAEDLVWKKAESDADAACATDPAQLVGREVQQPIRSGQSIPADAVRVVPLVRSGQFVTVTSRRPGIAIQRVVKAKGDGAAGEVIPLLTLEDHKTVLGRVTGLQEAEIIDGPAPQPAGAVGNDSSVIPASDSPPTRNVASSEIPAARPIAAADGPRVLVNPSQPLSVPSAGTE